ncbi:hypothetical protein LOTGIDRAFT_123530 [Lottia gigantea]|uniref:RING-type domain-containing protein n=1 Tax=Lottia gigantea TaxID=225164 RepID=V3ZG90_LOTGI|nr:hypothetical protein LOTGIDRAFT_123530 [Lottia gigantea]ESO90238.1 hypothetical protein LOTGIDRAFT_123530 [Lottia gigantea]
MEKLDKTCSICLHDRKQPKILTCLHVYCCQCLLDYVNKSLKDGQFPCPLSREQIQLPSGGVRNFRIFLKVMEVMTK